MVAPRRMPDHDSGLVAERVEERVDDEVTVVAVDLGGVRPRVGDADGLAVSRHDALALPGGART